ncbi:MAG: exopolyphosphatase, partial [Planctomycetota bacterium]|nr:exopolyphosphatase [Planctomycetota bacterium]
MESRPLDEAAIAAVDLGSNSFHLVVARELDGRPHVIDKVRVRVGLAEGLKGRKLDEAAQRRAFTALEMFRERLAAVPRLRIRAVGTATFRRVRDGGVFLRRSAECLGAPIEVLPGREEARLVY